jgi:hypothetical protein
MSLKCGAGEWVKSSLKFDKFIIPIQRHFLGLTLNNDTFIKLDIQQSLAEFNVASNFFPSSFAGLIAALVLQMGPGER